MTIITVDCCFRKPEFDDAPESIRVYNNSMVRFSRRVNFDIGCNMDFTYYPVDLQKCDVRLESFGYQIEVAIHLYSLSFNFLEELELKWRDIGGKVGPLIVSDAIHLPHYNHSICLVNPPFIGQTH